MYVTVHGIAIPARTGGGVKGTTVSVRVTYSGVFVPECPPPEALVEWMVGSYGDGKGGEEEGKMGGGKGGGREEEGRDNGME